uniref:GPI inositol-deacylase winged helix domain-containing protein n=1 Tax=Bionectria ochroleuca TaxID=29856 RepID=A0A8H7N165_BIOOC
MLISLPRNLDETYRRMVESIPIEIKSDAARLLQALVHSKRPLKLAEAKEVIATQIENDSQGFDVNRRLYSDENVLAYCPGLVTVVRARDKELHLAHLSVKEYLLRESQFKITTAGIPILRMCLTYLTDISSSHREMKRGFPMGRYAAEIWTGYAVLAQSSEAIVRATVRFLENKATFQRWARLYQADRNWEDDPGPPCGPGLYYACFDGLIAAAQNLLGNGADANVQGGRYRNALQAALEGGHLEIVKFLLDKGADVNEKGGEYGDALHAALERGYDEIVQLLLDKGADVNAQGDRYGNALQAAPSWGPSRDCPTDSNKECHYIAFKADPL